MIGPRFYQIPRSCEKSYIGQTGRSSKVRLKEHIVDTTHNCITNLAITEHSFKFKHLICFDQTKILASTPYYTSCIIREAFEIEKHHDNFNHEY